MSFNLAFLILIFLLTIYLIVIEIFTVIFMITGMSHTRSRFQVISLLTNCGFTTVESEIVVSSRKRRKIAIATMIFGNMFNVAIVSLLVNIIISFSKDGGLDILPAVLGLAAFFSFMILIKRIQVIRVVFDKLVKKIATRVMFSEKSNPLLVLDNFSGFVIVEVKIVEMPERFKGKTLLESRISKDYGIRVLTIKRDDETIGDISKDEIIRFNDRLIVFGPLPHIVKVFNQRPSH